MKLGFVGTGTIAEAVVRGLCHSDMPPCTIIVSPRGAENARRLARAFPSVAIASSNQDVVNQSEIVFLALRPQIAEDAIRSLTFKPGQRVVSFIATVSREMLQSWATQQLQITQAVPLPFVGTHLGATAIFPPTPIVAALFNRLGTAVEVEKASDLELLLTASALMGTYFGLLEHVAGWLEARGLHQKEATPYLRQLHAGLAHTLTESRSEFGMLRTEYSTKGGLNEQLFDVFSTQGGLAALGDGLEAVLARIRKNRPAPCASPGETQ